MRITRKGKLVNVVQENAVPVSSGTPLKKYVFRLIPVTLEHKLVDSKNRHEELLHWQDEIEVIRIRRGEIHCHVNDSDFLLHPGEVCFINYEQMHRVYNLEKLACDMDVLTVKTTLLAQESALYNKYVKPVISDRDFAHVQMSGRNSCARLISAFFDQLYDLARTQSDGFELDMIGYIFLMFRQLYLAYRSQDMIPVTYSSEISLQRRMTDYIYENYAKKISLDDIASAAGVNRSKCSALFRKYAQKTPFEFLNSYRLEMAAKLLTDTEESALYISQTCGFSGQSYFNRMFMKEYGVTPLEWRKKNRGESA